MAVNIKSIVNTYKQELDTLSRTISEGGELTVAQTNQAMADALGNALKTFIATAEIVVKPLTITNVSGLALISSMPGSPVTGTVTVPTHTEVII